MDKREYSLDELQGQRLRLSERIKHLEEDLKTPMSIDEDESAMEMKNREVLYSLYKVEKENLLTLEAKINQIV